MKTGTKIVIGAAATAVFGGVVWWALHFTDSGYTPPQLQARAGETWWIVMRPGDGLNIPLIGTVLSQKAGDATEGGVGNTVYTVKLTRDITFAPGVNVASARKISGVSFP